MFPVSSPTFSKLKCPHEDSCQFGADCCIFLHDPSVNAKDGIDGRIGLSSLSYFKNLHQRMRAEQAACTESQLFNNSEPKSESTDDKMSKAIENDLLKFLHRAPVSCKISVSLREKVLLKLIKAMRQVDASSSLSRAAEIENELLTKSGGGTVSSVYLSAVSAYVKRLGNGEEVGLSAQITQIDDDSRVTYQNLMEIVADKKALAMFSYPLPADDKKSIDCLVGVSEEVKKCRRCGVPFTPAKYYNSNSNGSSGAPPCRYHQGRVERISGLRVYNCCQAPYCDSRGCCTFEWHVFEGYKRGDPAPRYNSINFVPGRGIKRNIIGLDAEMFYTVGGYEVSRLTLVDFFNESVLLDVLVEPRCSPVLDYNTKFSGVSAKSYESKELEVLSFDEMKERLSHFIGPETILIGHSLDNDLLVLEFTHNLIVDTAILYPHPARPPYRMSLKALALGHLSELVQQSIEGHDSKEDCVTCIRLVKKYFTSGKREIERINKIVS